MADVKIQICLTVITDNNFTIIEQCVRDMFVMLLLKPDFVEGTSVVCSVCFEKLFAAFGFKSSCLHTENIVKAHVNSAEQSPLDIRDIYMEEMENKQLVNISDDQKVCRLCMKLVTTKFIVQEINSFILQSLIPEMVSRKIVTSKSHMPNIV